MTIWLLLSLHALSPSLGSFANSNYLFGIIYGLCFLVFSMYINIYQGENITPCIMHVIKNECHSYLKSVKNYLRKLDIEVLHLYKCNNLHYHFKLIF